MPEKLFAKPLVIVRCVKVVGFAVPVSTMTTRRPLVPVFKPSSVQLPGAVPTSQAIVIALVTHSDAVVDPTAALPVQDTPV